MGTQITFYRPKISAARKADLAAAAAKTGTSIASLLSQAIDEKIGRKRGATVRSESKSALDVLLRSVIIDLARYEDSIASLAESIASTAAQGLVTAEALDYVTDLQAAVLAANADLRRDLFGALERLRRGHEQKRDEQC